MRYADRQRGIVGEGNVFTDRVEMMSYSRDMSVHQAEPDAVVFPQCTEHVVEVLKLANESEIPVTPRAAGTSVTGASLAVKGGIVLNMTRMNAVIEVNRPNGYVVCQPGVVCNDLNAALGPDYFFPPDPGSSPICTVGGMVSLNASGVRAMKYGTTRDYVMGMEVVLADGRVLRTGRKAPKSSTGYNLSNLFAGAEGTLGVITELTLRIIPKPEYTGIVTAAFGSLEANGDAVTEILTSGIQLSTCEIMDNMSIRTVNEARGMDLPDVATYLIMELDGHAAAVRDQVERVMGTCRRHGAIQVDWTDDPKRRLEMWAGRGVLVPSLSRWKRRNRLIPILEDIGVPIAAIPEAIREIQRLPDKYGVKLATFGHVGDGNLHAVFVGDPTDRAQWDGARKVAEELVDIALRHGGTISAEHGVGISKSPFVRREVGGVAHDVMKAIKDALDPKGIMNPGKIGFDPDIDDIFSRWAFDELYAGNGFATSFGEEIDDEVLVCVQCGFCRAGCPVFLQSGRESTIARGRIQQAYSMMLGRDVPGEDIAGAFFTCTTCNLCQSVCPSGIKVTNVIQGIRASLAERGLLPEAHRRAVENVLECGNPFGEPREKRGDLYPRTFAPSDDPEVLLFLGCVASYQEFRIPPAIVELLNATGVSYTALGEGEECCGFLDYLVGQGFEEAMARNKAAIDASGAEIVVATCAGCYRAMADIYPRVLDGWDHRVVHAVEFLGGLVRGGRLELKPFPRRVAYHDPCDLARHMKLVDPPRDLLKAVPDLELVEFRKSGASASCCGGGGGLKGFRNEMSMDIALSRMREAAEVGAEVVVSACPTCKDNLAQAARRLAKEEGGPRILVMDIVELLHRSLSDGGEGG